MVSPVWEANCGLDFTGEEDKSAVWCEHKIKIHITSLKWNTQ